MASSDHPKYEEAKPASTNSSTASITQAARRVTGASEYFRNTILANVERLAGDAAIADEKERLARIGYQQMRGRSEEHTHTPPISDYPPETHHGQVHGTSMGATVPPGYVEPTKPGLKN
ncbi:uncharacterized protein DFL_001340 [Arthrobotrys flagrans]|uniref:Uncharacterized protein n=1 Tax=Arthrobotrys flagrans TaxID=97331 RepID=A0A437AGW1_ARTFL|nr:hypothetical protein DFL_001340 [Arthrobotrys flagrans]